MDRRSFLRGVSSLPFFGVVATVAGAAAVAPSAARTAPAYATGGLAGCRAELARIPKTVNTKINITYPAASREIGDKIIAEMRAYERRNGRGWRDG